jgi:sec-independent protein translocase protein TatC
MLPLLFGISFQLPMVMLFLSRINLFTVKQYIAQWKMAVLVIAILSMLLTPTPDPMTMILMMVPLLALYALGIGLCHWTRPKVAVEAAT